MNKENDLISREALKKAIGEYAETRQDTLLWQADVEEIIDNSPTVEPEVITLKPMTDEMTQDLIDKINTNVGMAQAISEEKIKGKWIVKSNGTTNHYACDKCGNAGDIQDKFCRECGADMRGDNNG